MSKLKEYQQERQNALQALMALRQLRNLNVLTMEEHKTIYLRMQKKFGEHLSVLR